MAKVITSSSAWMILVSCGAALSVCLKVRAENGFAAMWPDSTKKSWTLCKIQIKVQQLVFLSPCSKNASELLFDAQSWYCHLLQVKGTVHLIMKIQSLSKGWKKKMPFKSIRELWYTGQNCQPFQFSLAFTVCHCPVPVFSQGHKSAVSLQNVLKLFPF